jgi:hypothetical protein
MPDTSMTSATATSFLPIYDQRYGPLLDKRSRAFRRMFEILEQKEPKDYLIVETGCARWQGNWAGDGQSTLLWDLFVNTHTGRVFSVDIDGNACRMAQSQVSANTTVCCSDSVAFLARTKFDRPVDLLYLDSFDLDVRNPHPSSLHHLMELTAIMPQLRKGTLVVVDDNLPNGPGKGMYVNTFFRHLGVSPIILDYQLAWVLQ